jgi:hypothetical protein
LIFYLKLDLLENTHDKYTRCQRDYLEAPGDRFTPDDCILGSPSPKGSNKQSVDCRALTDT